MIATPPRSVPDIVKLAGEKDVGAAIIITSRARPRGRARLAQAALMPARVNGLRLVDPDSLRRDGGSDAKLNAEFCASAAPRRRPRAGVAIGRHRGRHGRVGGQAQGVGFSASWIAGRSGSTSTSASCLDYFALDRATRARIL